MSKLSRLSLFILVFSLLIGSFLRFTNLNWDSYRMFHPDERNIASAVVRLDIPRQLDPGFHAYNGFFIYATRLTAQATATLTNDPIWLHDWGHVNLLARYLSATFSVLSLLLIFLLARRFLPSPWPALSSLFLALSPGLIQYAHYGVTESLLLFLLLSLSLAATNTYHHPQKLSSWFPLALISGVSLATKTSATTFLLIPAVIWLLAFISHRSPKLIFLGFYFLVLTALTFFIFSPYTFLDLTRFQQSMNYEGGVVSGKLPVPYTLQFTGTPPYWYFFINLFWQLNPLTAILGLLGFFFLLYFTLKKPKFRPLLPLLVFSFVYAAIVGSWHTKFIRYSLLLTPAFIFGAVYALRHSHKTHPRLSLIFSLTITLVSLIWSLSYLNIFTSPQTRLTASIWMYQNLPQGSTILHEHWDDRVPIDLPAYSFTQFTFDEQKVYDPDSLQKLDTLLANLAYGDYYVISSRRVYGSIMNNPNLYPLTSHFYQLLFQEKLGYTLLKEFSSYPRLGPLIFKDDTAEETFQVYDHPHIYVFANTSRYSLSKLNEAFSAQESPTP